MIRWRIARLLSLRTTRNELIFSPWQQDEDGQALALTAIKNASGMSTRFSKGECRGA
jgi:hypothetical protein